MDICSFTDQQLYIGNISPLDGNVESCLACQSHTFTQCIQFKTDSNLMKFVLTAIILCTQFTFIIIVGVGCIHKLLNVAHLL